MSETYDFIVVGSGPAGSALAAGLAGSYKKPKVLLLESGDQNDDRNLRVDGQRWLTFMNPSMNWGYKTSPQENCHGRECDYSRGKGLGGSSAINFGVFTLGARDDYEEWARIVGDSDFGWAKMQARYKALVSFDTRVPAGVDPKYVAPRAADHGSSGPLKLGFAAEWEDDLVPMLDIFEKAGFPINPDHNSGNPLGMAVLISSASKGLRSTAQDLLVGRPENLTVLTRSAVQRVVLKGKRAVGVESNGKKYFASKEVILCAGALDSPRIMMHSGLGPADQLRKFNIPVVQDMPAVGQGLRDHMFAPLVYKRAETSTARASFYGDEAAMAAALEQWKRDGTGPWSRFACETTIGYFKLDAISRSPEFAALPADERRYLNAPTVPHVEYVTHFPFHLLVPDFPKADLSYSCLMAFLYNAQSRGEVTLQSADPDAPLRFDPKFLAHPFDRRAAVESLRALLGVAASPAYACDTVAQMVGPRSASDEDLLAHWRDTMSSSWHMTGTLKMGRAAGEPGAVVDPAFRVFGVAGLRVADMSAVPVLASCHIQSVAYLTGMACADKLIAEYSLSRELGVL